jgi:hypothetical protein
VVTCPDGQGEDWANTGRRSNRMSVLLDFLPLSPNIWPQINHFVSKKSTSVKYGCLQAHFGYMVTTTPRPNGDNASVKQHARVPPRLEILKKLGVASQFQRAEVEEVFYNA